jgi:hypothetical protein
MAKKQDLFDIVVSKDGSRLVAKLSAKKITVEAYDGSNIVLEKGDYLEVKKIDELRKDLEFFLEKEYISQESYDKSSEYLDLVSESFRARVSARKK